MWNRKRKLSPTQLSLFATASNAITLCLLCSSFLVVCPPAVHCTTTEAETGLKILPADGARRKGPLNDVHTIDTQSIQDMILEYIDQTLNRRTFQILSGLTVDAKNKTAPTAESDSEQSRSMVAMDAADTFDGKISRRLRRFAETHVVNLSIPRVLDAGARTFFFKSISTYKTIHTADDN